MSTEKVSTEQKGNNANCVLATGLTPEEYKEWESILIANPPEPYEQSESYNAYFERKWRHREKLAINFLRSKNKRHF
jgi:hypothetical protein